MSHEFSPWSKQDQAMFAYIEHGSRLTIFAAGVQCGKTSIGVQWLKLMTLLHREMDDNFIITSPSFRILEQSTLPPFLRAMDGLGTFRRQGMYLDVHGGGRVWMRTATDPDSVVGITNVRAILCDEAGLYSKYFFDNIMARAAFKQAPIMIVTSPYSQNWLYCDYVRKLERDPNAFDRDVVLIQARSDESPYFPKSEYERQKGLMDSRRFEMVFGGRFGAMEGLVYDCFDDTENTCPEMSLPIGTHIYGGVDWGNRHAFVIHVRAITPDGNHYQVAEFYRAGCNPLDMVAAAASLKLGWGVEVFYCDPSQPGMIDLFCAKGLPSVAADNDIKIGIGFHYELVKTRKFKIFEARCPYSLDEYSTYHYPSPKDLKPDQDEKEIKPVKVSDDAMDAARYCTIMTYKKGEPKRPTKGGESQDINKLSHDKQIELLKRPKRFEESLY